MRTNIFMKFPDNKNHARFMSYYELKQGHLRSYSDVPIFNLPTVTCISCSTGDLLHKMSIIMSLLF